MALLLGLVDVEADTPALTLNPTGAVIVTMDETTGLRFGRTA